MCNTRWGCAAVASAMAAACLILPSGSAAGLAEVAVERAGAGIQRSSVLRSAVSLSARGPSGEKAFNAGDPVVATDPGTGEYFVVWTLRADKPRTGITRASALMGQRVSADGALSGEPVVLAPATSQWRYIAPDIAWSPTARAWVVVFTGEALVPNKRPKLFSVSAGRDGSVSSVVAVGSGLSVPSVTCGAEACLVAGDSFNASATVLAPTGAFVRNLSDRVWGPAGGGRFSHPVAVSTNRGFVLVYKRGKLSGFVSPGSVRARVLSMRGVPEGVARTLSVAPRGITRPALTEIPNFSATASVDQRKILVTWSTDPYPYRNPEPGLGVYSQVFTPSLELSGRDTRRSPWPRGIYNGYPVARFAARGGSWRLLYVSDGPRPKWILREVLADGQLGTNPVKVLGVFTNRTVDNSRPTGMAFNASGGVLAVQRFLPSSSSPSPQRALLTRLP